MSNLTILIGDVREKLRELPDASVRCVVTSPPYWALRDYGAEGQIGSEATPQEFVAVDREQARRVAWRQLYRWVQAQVALIQTGMVKTQEVFMPYLRTSTGQTVYELAEQRGFKLMLPAPEAQQ